MTPFVGQIQSFAFGLVPRGWAPCNGQLLAINQYQALFSLLGTTFGGDGINTFALPDLRGRSPVSQGQSGNVSFPLGQKGGEEAHTLSLNEVPPHNHAIMGSTNNSGLVGAPASNLPGQPATAVYAAGAALNANLNNAAIASAGGSQPHENRQPFLVINWCISLTGIFPSRN